MAALSLLILFSLPIWIHGQVFYKSNHSATPEKATELCDLATPIINYTETGQIAYVPAVKITGDEKLWVGYARSYTAFTYIGCLGWMNFNNYRVTTHIQDDPGICYSYCKTQFIGMRFKPLEYMYCYCIDEIKDSVAFSKSCTNQCDFPPSVLCGGSDSNTTSVYQKVDYSKYNTSKLQDDDPDGSCLAYDHIGFHFWSSCDNSLIQLCKNANGIVQYDVSNKTYGTWAASMQLCLSRNLLPVNPGTNLSAIATDTGQLWTGTIRSFSITQLTGTTTDTQLGHIEHDGNNTILVFDINNESNKALCKTGGDEPTTTTTSSTTTTTTSLVTTTNTSSAQSPVTQSSPTSTSSSEAVTMATHSSHSSTHKVTSTTNDTHTTSAADGSGTSLTKSGSKNLVAVYVVVPILILLAAAIVVFIIWRKRRNARSKEDENSTNYHNTKPSHKKPATKSVSNAAYQADHVIQAPPREIIRHDYLELEPHSPYDDINDARLNNNTDGDYDTTRTFSVKQNGVPADTGNVYNRLDDIDDHTYDHTNAALTRDDDAYNHTGYDRNESAYNTTETLSRSRQGAPVSENDYNTANGIDDTYNHTNGERVNVGMTPSTDGTYNTTADDMRSPQQVAESYEYTKPAMPKRPPPKPDNLPSPSAAYDNTSVARNQDATGKPFKFEFDQLPNSGGYEFAREPPSNTS